MNPRDIKRRANSVRKCLIEGAEHYYDKKYKNLRVADLLIVLEADNYHSEEVVLEALATLDYTSIVEACKLEVEQDTAGHLTYGLSERRQKLLKRMEGE